MQEINAWLNSDRDFNAGSALYGKYGTNSFFKKILHEQGATQYNVKKLAAELIDLAPAQPAPVSFDAPNISIDEALPDHQITGDQETPVNIANPKDMQRYLSLKATLKQHYNHFQRNMVLLDVSTDQRILLKTAASLSTLQDKITGIYDLLDFFDEHNHFPIVSKTVETVKTPKQELDALYTSNWKAEKRLENPHCRDKEKTKLLITTNLQRIAQLKEELAYERD
ncbi:hypothetical protein [Pedobacter ginsengisoli]|uniref:hypothetical protein n=1 Tax=Pedobacter ginsengisoli TaxID=363852 RepID=UPI00254E1A58|nr:hypothetical protein [Pedobacter ginsengisoli]